jgi:threonine/homoserine/homoserine lactone efflux protein
MLPLPTASLVAFVGLAALLVATPGMSTAVVLRNTAEGGRRAGVTTALGIALGNATWATAAGLGLGALLHQWPGALEALRMLGAVCLTWLGVNSLRRAWQLRRDPGDDARQAAHARTTTRLVLFGEGTVTNLLNPSIPVFYLASVPQFIGKGDRFAAAFALLGGIHVTMALACHSAYAVAFGRVARALAARGRAWVLHTVTGAALIALAAASVF